MDPVYQGDTSVSLESWHDTIHGLIGTGVGSGGHMGYPPIAGVISIRSLQMLSVVTNGVCAV